MSLLGCEGRWRCWVFVCVLVSVMVGLTSGNVVLMGKNVSMSFEDLEATFAPPINESGECGRLYISQPLDACSSLTNKITEGPYSRFVLIIRGGCSFYVKVRNAQAAGYNATIIYDNEDRSTLVSMAGDSAGIYINAVFVSKASGEILKRFAGRDDVELWIIPVFRSSLLSIVAISFICLLAVSAMLATCFFVRRHLTRREQPRVPNIRQFRGMSSKLVKAMPSVTFTPTSGESCSSTTCAICLEDYDVGDKLRVLPCRHRFHTSCVDSWLTSWRSFCPICKQDARTGISTPPASEHTPLLSSRRPSFCSNAGSPVHPSVAPSSPAPILVRSESFSRPSSPSSSLVCNVNRSYTQSPAISIHKSFIDLGNSLPYKSSSRLNSFGSSDCLYLLPINAAYASSRLASSSIGSPSCLAASSSRQSFLRRNSDSLTNLSFISLR